MTTPESQPIMIFHDFESNNSNVKLTEWPLHFTLTPFFTLDNVPQAEALSFIKEISQSVRSIEIEPGEMAMYGPNNDIPVTRINDISGELMQLHQTLIRGLGEIGCQFVDLSYSLDNYSPHISHKSSHPVPTSLYSVDSISVAIRLPKIAEANKVILENITLG